MSCQGIRRCTPEEIHMLNQLWNQIKPHMDASSTESYVDILSWCNFYENQQFKLDFPLKKQWLEWAQRLTQQICPQNHILCASFVRNPARSQKNQIWHNDYQSTNTIMIPLVDQICETATQIIELPLKQKAERSALGYDSHYGEDVLELMQKQGLEFMKITQIVCRSHMILKVSEGTVHRGIANRVDSQRVLFTINCSPKFITLNQQPIVISNFSHQQNQQELK